MNDRIIQEALARGFEYERTAVADELRVVVGLHLFVLTFPRYPAGTLEWFVEVRSIVTGEELGRDWSDHYADGGETRLQLVSEREAEAIALLKRIVCGHVDPANVWGDSVG